MTTARESTYLPLATALLAVATVAGCEARASQKAAAEAPAAPLSVSTTEVATRPWPRTLTLTGTLAANRDSDVAADAMGKVVATFVERGQFIAKGAPLVQLDRRSAVLAEEQARAQAASAKAQLDLAERECARAETLFAQAAINRAEYDRAKAHCESARQSATATGAQARLAAKSLGDAIVRAPFAGMIVERTVTEGEYVRPDIRVVTLVDVDTLRLELQVPEAALARVTASQEVSFRVAAFPGETFTGQIRYVGGAVRRQSRDLLVEAVVANKDRRLRPGMFASAAVHLGEEPQIVVPVSAVRAGSEISSDRVFVVKNGRVEERLVSLGGHEGTGRDEIVAVRSGLAAGERVVVPATAELRDGLAVK